MKHLPDKPIYCTANAVKSLKGIAKSVLHSVAGFIHLMKELKFKNKKAAAFGCYGWSGESVKVINDLMADAGFDVINEGFRNSWNPDADSQQAALDFGKKIAV